MITHIYVKNFALIKELHLDLEQGFTTLTGETGAGKSILLGALGLVLGNRADVKALADIGDKCIVEAHFAIADLKLESFFTENELDFEPTTILRREILTSGKSRAFINDTPVLLDVLKALGERLVDVHSQHDSLLLMNSEFQLQLLDTLADNEAERKLYAQNYAIYVNLQKQYTDLLAKLDEKRDTDYLQFLVEELETARISAGEELQLETELKVLRHAEEIQVALGDAINNLQDENAALDRLHAALRQVEQVAAYLENGADLVQRMQSVEIELKDLTTELEDRAVNVSLDEERLNNLEERQNTISHLLQKHRVASTEDLLEKQELLSNQLHLATSGARALQELETAIEKAQLEVLNAGSALRKTRLKTAKKLSADVATYLQRLQLKGANLFIEIEETSPRINGNDQINLLFSANTGSKPQLLAKVASGGELSRVMLALKAIMAQTKSLPAIIFDEIDTGISGETANKVAEILMEMGQRMQVLAITHLPQIAAKGKQQLQVVKTQNNGGTATQIKPLKDIERVEAIAQLLSGAQVSDAARKTAEELLAS